MDTTQTVHERSRNMSRSLQGHDLFSWEAHLPGQAREAMECPQHPCGPSQRSVNGQRGAALLQVRSVRSAQSLRSTNLS